MNTCANCGNQLHTDDHMGYKTCPCFERDRRDRRDRVERVFCAYLANPSWDGSLVEAMWQRAEGIIDERDGVKS